MRVLVVLDCASCGVAEALVHDPALLADPRAGGRARRSAVAAVIATPGEPNSGACDCGARCEECPHQTLALGAAALDMT
jgi:hypothetical protein